MEYPLLLVALKQLNVHQRLWHYLKLHDLKLPVEFVEFRDSYNDKALIIWLDNATVVYIKPYLMQKFETIGYTEQCTMTRQHGVGAKPIINRSENLFEIIFVVGASSRVVLRNFPKTQESKIARLELVLREFVPKDQDERFTDTWITSHEYPLELLPFVNNVLEKAVAGFKW